MSADRRKQIMIGFGVLAVVLVATITLVSPRFRSDDAIGAIGAVQKHRAPQIAQKDVILGDEQTKQQQQLQYGDFLADAASLQNISANMSTASRTESASRLSARSEDLRARYFSAARGQVAGMKAYFAKDSLEMKKLESLDADVNAAASRSLNSEEIGALNARLESMMHSFETALNTRNLASIDADVASLSARIDSRQDLEAARSTLAAAAHALDARSNAASMIRARASYLDAMARESRAVESAQQSMSMASKAQSILGSAAQELSQRAVLSMKNNLESATADVDALGHMSASLSAVSRAVESRSNTYNAASLASFRQESASFARAVDSRNAEAQARATAEMRGQLNMIGNYLGSVRNLDARSTASRASIAECQAQLQSINHAAQSRSVYASVLNADSLSNKQR